MKHAEDEIAAMNMAIGASHMGARSMTASSGGGFSLMVEALGMAAITETPLVLVLGLAQDLPRPANLDGSKWFAFCHARLSQGEFPVCSFYLEMLKNVSCHPLKPSITQKNTKYLYDFDG